MLDAALTHAGNSKGFAAYLHNAGGHEIADLRLGKKTDALYAQAEKLHKQLTATPTGRRPIIVDRALYRALVKGAIKRTRDELEAKAAIAAKEKKTARASKQPADPVTVVKRERDQQLRDLRDQAHEANLDLGHALLHNLATVDPGPPRRPLLRPMPTSA